MLALAAAALLLSWPESRRVHHRLPMRAAHRTTGWLRSTATAGVRLVRSSGWAQRPGAGVAASTDEVCRALPDVVDLLRLAVAGGATVQQGLRSVHRHIDGRVGAAFGDAIAAVEAGSPVADEIERLCAVLGPSSRSLIALLRASLLDGVPLAPALDRLADELRADRRRHAEAAARRLPVRLLFPLVCCALPALVLLSVVPLLVGTFRSLRL